MIEQYIASDKVSMMYDLLEVVSETHYTIGKGKDDTGNEIQHRNVNPFLFRQFTGLFLDYADDLAPLLYINQEKVRFLQILIGNVIISSRDIDELLQKLETLDSDYFTGELLKHFFTILKPKRSEEEMSRVTDLSNGVLYGILQESDLPGSVKYGIYSAVANPRRTILTQDCIKIVQILLKRQVTETDLSEILGISRFTVSEYLNILVQTQPITVEKIGNQLYFSIRNRYACEAKNLLHNLQRALEREVKRYVFMDLPKD